MGFHTETGDGTAGTKRESKWKRSCNAGPGRASRTPSGGHADRSPGGGTAGHRDPGQHRGETEAREGLRVARPPLTSQPDRWLEAHMSRSGHKWRSGHPRPGWGRDSSPWNQSPQAGTVEVPPTEAGAGRSAWQRVKVQQGPAEGLQPPAAATSSCSLRASSNQELGASVLRTLLRLFSVPT